MQFVCMGVLPEEHRSAKVKQIKNPPGWFQWMVGWHLLSYDIVYFNILYFNTLSICAHVCVYVTCLADAFILENLERKELRNF